VLFLVGAVTLTLFLAGSVVAMRLSVTSHSRRIEERRAQVLWLARSAAVRAQDGAREVLIEGEKVKVVTAVKRDAVGFRTTVSAAGPWGTARVVASTDRFERKIIDWEETFDRAK
jgi:hypothetical protein